ncbi:ABC-2 type transporter [Desulfatibacillum aliphaticivorans]|uniref:ABC-2 type transporter n=1 Tax=Desulfatibacillum aliphaticivorans TaxID=218208 RepID=B8FDU4_DESAL|nr:ABC transporter permease [Desulfatibacillum aliphaticivorans]ACL06725.1 ABC-2 type transporter [Desulfatibacillum aliphaticivorans]
MKKETSAAFIWLQRHAAMIRKELVQLLRDKLLVFFLIYAFSMDIILAGGSISLDLKNASLWVRDLDHKVESRELMHRFQPPAFRLKGGVDNAHEIQTMMDKGEAMATLDFGPDFSENIHKGRQATTLMQVDATNSVLGTLAASHASHIVFQFSLEKAQEKLAKAGAASGGTPSIRDAHRVWFNPNQRDSWFMSITELLTIITVFAVMLPATAMVREKERGTVEQLLVSPLSTWQIMLPKILSMTFVILLGTAVSLFCVIRPIFHTPIRGSLPLFFGVTALYVFTTSGLSLFISTLARNLAQVGLLTILVLAPMLFLSGAWTPPEAMPGWLRFAMVVSPLHHYIDTGFGILLKGAGMEILWDSVGMIALIGGIMLSVGAWRFRRQFH